MTARDIHTTAEDEADADAATADRPAPGEPAQTPTDDDRRWGRRIRSAVPWVLAVLALAAAIFSTVQWQSLQAEADARDRVAVATTGFVTTLTNWDASDGLEQTRQRLQEAGTGNFLEEMDEFFAPLTGQLPADITSTGRVEDVYVQRIQGETAEAFAVVVQTVSRNGESETNIRRTAISLSRVDDRWLVADVRLVSDAPITPPSEEAP